MQTKITELARSLISGHGKEALAECQRRLDAATAMRDHPAGMLWADVGSYLAKGRCAGE